MKNYNNVYYIHFSFIIQNDIVIYFKVPSILVYESIYTDLWNLQKNVLI